MKNIRKKIAVGLLGLTMLGAVSNMPAIQVGNHTIGTENVSAATTYQTYGYGYIQSMRVYQGAGRGYRYYSRNVDVYYVRNRYGQIINYRYVYSGWWSVYG